MQMESLFLGEFHRVHIVDVRTLCLTSLVVLKELL